MNSKYYESREFYDRVKPMLKKRLGEEKYLHSVSVSKTALKLARLYNVNEGQARTAGLLHDWNKEISDAKNIRIAKKAKLDLPHEYLETMPHMLHGPTAAVTLGRKFPNISPKILKAISLHTSAGVEMSDLDKLIYCADALEPLRGVPVLDAIRRKASKISLDELLVECMKATLDSLLARRREIHPQTVIIWNHHVKN